MKGRVGPVAAFVEALVRDRRPPRFPSDPEDAEALQMAARLRGVAPGAGTPSPRFVDGLQRTLAESLGERPHPAGLTRRRFLEAAGAAAAAGVLGAGVDHIVTGRGSGGQAAPAAQVLMPSGGRWLRVAAVGEVRVGRPVRFTTGSVSGFVVNHGDRLEAVSAVCTHMGCLVRSNEAAQRLDCPCHGASFALDGSSLNREYLRPLTRLQTRVNGTAVEVFAV